MTREVGRRRFLGATGGVLVGGRLLTSASGTSAATQATEAWRQFGYDASNTGYAPDNTGPVEDIEEQWTFEAGSAVESSPAVADGTVYVGSRDGLVYGPSVFG
jgi:outer membrane protein assembly factor BamB